VDHNPIILGIFVVTYVGIAIGHFPGLKLNRVGIALLGAIAMMLFAGVAIKDVVSYINWPTIFLLFGFFVVAAQLRLSGFYDKVAGGIAARLAHPARFLLILMLVTAGLSAILNHDIICFVFTPIVAAALLKRQLNPVPFLIALAIASNIGAAATVIGNPQGLMISEVAHLSFGRYFVWCAVPVLAALAAAYAILWWMSRRHLELDKPSDPKTEQPTQPFNRYHTVKGLIILAVVIGLFFSPLPKVSIALAAAGIHLASKKFRTNDLLGFVNWPILILFAALFVVTGTFQSTGYGDQAAQALAQRGFSLNSPLNFVATTAVLSNLIGNSAAVMLLLKFVDVSRPSTAYILALANSFGGSLLIIGSVANIVVVQQARELGVKISFGAFARLGIPVTIAALGLLWVWIALVT
jgi:Na+/H+ antiporter NhaD/arsenite permease-like protein